jgi:N-methylhydantoinase B/oxoprolinase/acetone carboxylase alpha subunit
LDREPERVLEDVQRKIFTLEMAQNVFGVVIDTRKWSVDVEATKTEREKIKAKRKERGKIWEGNR